MSNELTVLVCTYNPDINKLEMTLNSIFLQRDIVLNIIIADDGSNTFDIKKVTDIFNKNSFENYQIVIQEKNVGTVKNIVSGLSKCTTRYVKLLSPGDMLYGFTVMNEWVSSILNTNKDVAFSICDAVYYTERDNIKFFTSNKTFPQNPKFLNSSNQKLLNRYLIWGDNCLGAATICDSKKLLKYLSMIQDKVIYTEDTVYRLMIACKEKAHYFPKTAILYEYGVGVSTSNDTKWQRKLDNDVLMSDEIILKSLYNDKKTYLMYEKLVNYRRVPNNRNKYLYYLSVKSAFLYKLIRKILGSRYSCCEKKEEFIKSLGLTIDDTQCR